MKIGIQFVGIPGSGLLRHAIAKRVYLQLRRFGSQVGEVAVRIEAAGPRGSGAERCRIITSGPDPTITVEGEGPHFYSAVEMALEQMDRHLSSRANDRARPYEAMAPAE